MMTHLIFAILAPAFVSLQRKIRNEVVESKCIKEEGSRIKQMLRNSRFRESLKPVYGSFVGTTLKGEGDAEKRSSQKGCSSSFGGSRSTFVSTGLRLRTLCQ